jgi:hypothetical protein
LDAGRIESEGGERCVADKGCDDDKLIWRLKTQDIEAEIPPRCNRKIKRLYDKTVYAWRRGIENLFAKRTENRRLALQVDKLEATFGRIYCPWRSLRWVFVNSCYFASFKQKTPRRRP